MISRSTSSGARAELKLEGSGHQAANGSYGLQKAGASLLDASGDAVRTNGMYLLLV